VEPLFLAKTKESELLKSVFLLAVLLSATALSVLAVEPASRYVGMRYSGRADDFSFGEGYMITDEYSVSVVSKSGQRMWWLSKLLFRDKRGSPIWQVVAAMDTPKVPAGYTLFMAVCNKKGIKGGSVIAAARLVH
jgi:hypothetical protein